MTTTDLPPSRRKAYLEDIELQLERLGLQLALARGERARDRVLSQIGELKLQRERLSWQ